LKLWKKVSVAFRLHFSRRKLVSDQRFNPNTDFYIDLSTGSSYAWTRHPESPMCLSQSRVARSFERHDSITITMTHENSSSSFLQSSLAFPRKATSTFYYTRCTRPSLAFRVTFFTIEQESKLLSLPTLDLVFFFITRFVIYGYRLVTFTWNSVHA